MNPINFAAESIQWLLGTDGESCSHWTKFSFCYEHNILLHHHSGCLWCWFKGSKQFL